MPHSELHKKKLKKNLAIGGLVLLWCVMIWMVTMIRMANAADEYSDPYHISREAQLEHGKSTKQQWDDAFFNAGEQQQQEREQDFADRSAHLDHNHATKTAWDDTFFNTSADRQKSEETMDAQRMHMLEKGGPMRRQWWESWAAHQIEKSE